MSGTFIGSSGVTFPDSSVQATAATGFGFKNRIINGAFQIWQRGTSFTDSGISNYYVDRWRSEGYPVSGNVTISQQTFTAGQTAVPGFPQYYVQIATGGTIASGQYWAFQQRIEAPQNLSGYETVTLSFWARVPSGTLAAGTFMYGVGGTAASNPALSTTWQKITLTQSLSYGYGSGYVPVYVVSLPAGTAATTVQIANVQVEIGSTATSFDYRPYGTELQLCQRYFEKSYDQGVNPASNTTTGSCWFSNGGAANVIQSFPFAVEKRTDPTMSIWDTSGNANCCSWGNISASFTAGNSQAVPVQFYGTRSVSLRNSNGISGAVTIGYHWTASAEL